MHSSRWRGPVLAGLAVLVAVLAVGGWLGVRGLAAQRHLEAAQAELTTARQLLTDLDPASARQAVQRAGVRTGRARELTGDPLWALASALPRLGATPAAARAVARAADDVTREVLPPVLAAGEQLDPGRLRAPDGAVRLDVVQAATPSFVTASRRATEVAAGLDARPDDGVVGRVGRRATEVQAQFDELAATLTSAAEALEVAPVLLGADRPMRYLLLVQQTSEARGTGGIFGGFVVLEADAGRLTAVQEGSNSDLENGEIEPPPGLSEQFVDLYQPIGGFRFWQNANLSPDLPAVAQVVQARWAAQGGAPLDGVAVLDATALSMVLAGSGPLPLADGEVAPSDLADYLAVGQYRDFAPVVDGQFDQTQARKDQLEEVASTVADRFTGAGTDTRTLLQGLSTAVRSGHVRMASDDPVLGPMLTAAGVDGALPAGPAPVAYAVVNNATAGKLDYFLDRTVSYTAGACTGDRRRSTVTVELRNDVPVGDLPPYLTISSTPAGPAGTRDLTLTLTVYGTAGAELVSASVDGRQVSPEPGEGPVVTAAQEAGLPRYTVRLVVPEGGASTFTLELDEPSSAGVARVPEQPLARPLERDVSVPAC